MFATEFEYQKVSSVSEAIQLLSNNEGAKILAGGHSLIPLMKLRLAQPPLVIDIGGIDELKGISVENGTLRIGALTTHAEISESHVVQDAAGILWEAAWPPTVSATPKSGTGGPSAATSPMPTRRRTCPPF